jgi:hypothetical protein
MATGFFEFFFVRNYILQKKKLVGAAVLQDPFGFLQGGLIQGGLVHSHNYKLLQICMSSTTRVKWKVFPISRNKCIGFFEAMRALEVVGV